MSAERELLKRLVEADEKWERIHSRSAMLHEISGQARALLAQPERDPGNGRWYDADSIDRMVRELDAAMNGERAAQQAALCDIMGQLLQRIQAQPEREPQWQPIETAPTDGTGVIYFSESGGCYVGNHPPGCAAGRWHWLYGRWRGQADDRAINATHWMPLPKPPEE